MFYKLMICLCAVLSAAPQEKDKRMTNELVTIKTKCKGNEHCRYTGHNLFLEISITNSQPVAVGYPLAFCQQSGPSIRLVDPQTKEEAYLKTNLADSDLKEQFTEIPPGKSIVLRWVITSAEIDQFATPLLVDILAEISLYADINLGGKRVETESTDTIHITGHRLP
jgi:hypothetical protein